MTEEAPAVEPLNAGSQTIDPQDWVTIWQSEWAAIAVDRELQEGLAAAAVAWGATFAARADGPAGCPGADAPAGATPVDAASIPRPAHRPG